MCHFNDALACLADRIAQYESNDLPAALACAAALHNLKGDEFAACPHGAGAPSLACCNHPYRGAQA